MVAKKKKKKSISFFDSQFSRRRACVSSLSDTYVYRNSRAIISMQCTARVANWMFVIRFLFLFFFFFSLFLLTLSLSLSDCRLMLSKLAIGISYANRVPRAKPSRSIDSQTVRRRQSDRETDWLTNLSASSVHPSRSLERGWARAFQGGRFGQSPSTSASTSDDNKHGLRNLWTLSSYSYIQYIYDIRSTTIWENS